MFNSNNYGYGYNYQPYSQNYQQLQQFQTNQNQNQIQSQQQEQNVNWIKVNGIEGAKNHIVQPNCTAWLMDNNDTKFYVKSVDAYGVPTLKSFAFAEIPNETNPKSVLNETQVNLSDYVKKSEIDEIITNKINQLADLYDNSKKGGK